MGRLERKLDLELIERMKDGSQASAERTPQAKRAARKPLWSRRLENRQARTLDSTSVSISRSDNIEPNSGRFRASKDGIGTSQHPDNEHNNTNRSSRGEEFRPTSIEIYREAVGPSPEAGAEGE